MRKILGILLIALILAISVFAQIKVPKLELKQRTLSNGMKIVTHRDTSSPSVAIHVWYDVGGKNDPPGKSGFAHMFEHMMFKSTKNMPNEKMDRLTEDVGGFNNASTWDDFTNYYEVVPANHLEVLLWAEAERMQNLNVDQTNYNSEKEVVKEEFRQGVLANPYGRFFEFIGNLSFQQHPYKRGVIGNLDELNAASIDDANNFYKTYYRPDNATLIVVGDFEQSQLDTWVEKYFARIPKPSGSIPRVTVKESAWTKERRYEKFAPIVPFPAVAIIFQSPPSNSPDIPALKVAETILSGGESSRLYQELIYKQQIAQEASFSVDLKIDGGLLQFVGIGAEGSSSAKLEKSLLSELKKIQTSGVTAKELAKAKNQMIAGKIRALEDNDGKAIAIERAMIYQGNADAVNNEVQQLQTVTAADVQRVLKKYLAENNRVVIYYNQEKGGSDAAKK
ncbi:MAG: pitrilysin family protein [Acidobacteriota bacterium]